jgi:biopolymer transport protein ExbD
MIKINRQREDVLINVVPMIDLMIFLIVFFLCATTFSQREKEHDVLLPKTRGTGSLSGMLKNNVIINVKKDGAFVVAGRRYNEGELLKLVAERRAAGGNAFRVKVRADRRTPYGLVATALSIVEKAGVSKPLLETKELGAE